MTNYFVSLKICVKFCMCACASSVVKYAAYYRRWQIIVWMQRKETRKERKKGKKAPSPAVWQANWTCQDGNDVTVRWRWPTRIGMSVILTSRRTDESSYLTPRSAWAPFERPYLTIQMSRHSVTFKATDGLNVLDWHKGTVFVAVSFYLRNNPIYHNGR